MTTSTTDAEAIARIIRLAMYDSSASEGPDELARIAGTYANAILSYLASRREAQEPIQITMQDVRLMAGEGTLTASDTLAAVNAHLRAMHRRTAPPAPAGEVERLREALEKIKSLLSYANQDNVIPAAKQSNINSAWWQARAALNGGRSDER